MHTESSEFMRASARRIFEIASDLERWPEYLPHYRHITVLERDPDGSVVVEMAARRGVIPVSWVSRYRADPSVPQMRFEHLRAFTKGMVVVWDFAERDDGTLVTIRHDLNFRWPPLAPLADLIIGRFFIGGVAPRTLRCFRDICERRTP